MSLYMLSHQQMSFQTDHSTIFSVKSSYVVHLIASTVVPMRVYKYIYIQRKLVMEKKKRGADIIREGFFKAVF